MWHCFIMLHKIAPSLMSVDETLVCEHSNESYRAVLSYGTVYLVLVNSIFLAKTVQGGSNF